MKTHFDYQYTGIKPQEGLYLPVLIRQSKKAGEKNQFKLFYAVWDTGSNVTAISQKVVEECEMVSEGKKILDHYGRHNTDTFCVDIGFSEDSMILHNLISVLKQTSSGTVMTNAGELEIDILLGMNAILKTNFSIKNLPDKTIVSFDILNGE